MSQSLVTLNKASDTYDNLISLSQLNSLEDKIRNKIKKDYTRALKQKFPTKIII